MKKVKEFFSNIDFGFILIVTLIVLVICLILGCIATTIYCFITYGGKPFNEIPAWALFFMFNWGR